MGWWKWNSLPVQENQNSGNEPKTGMKMIPFALLFPLLEPQLAKDKVMLLQSLFAKLRKGEIENVHVIRHMKNTVVVEMLRWAVLEVQSKASRQ
ncbi:hypothetical protein Tsubulata_014556 [Turnera subulata]|uniref:RST domain-containing protein n=1 Tax=Turnera subulata TaxID=218843 RepID=A0A9Q0J6B7_9ROSI|nr:hypothetical protein Tsubulata_014556 [Turnera subulata]